MEYLYLGSYPGFGNMGSKLSIYEIWGPKVGYTIYKNINTNAIY